MCCSVLLTDCVHSEDFEEKIIRFLLQKLIPQETGQFWARNRPIRTLHWEPENGAVHTHIQVLSNCQSKNLYVNNQHLISCTWYQTGHADPSYWCPNPAHVTVQPAAARLTLSAADWPELRGPVALIPPPPAHAHLHTNTNTLNIQTDSSHHFCVFLSFFTTPAIIPSAT